MLLILGILGLIVGSFLGALTWRMPREKSISRGRSVCDRCGKQIPWYHNIPIFSFLSLKGKTACCRKKLSIRYPLIEASTGLLFMLTYLNLETIQQNISLLTNLSSLLSLLLTLLIFTDLLAIFVIDFEHQIIPDKLVFPLYSLVVALIILASPHLLYAYVLSGLLAATFLLILNLATLGKGMGLGDVKLALLVGAILGPQLSVLWLFLGFVLGAIIGLLLITIGKAKFGKHIAFGPFLVLAFYLVSILASKLLWLIPF